jgi:hypothetical protein
MATGTLDLTRLAETERDEFLRKVDELEECECECTADHSHCTISAPPEEYRAAISLYHVAAARTVRAATATQGAADAPQGDDASGGDSSVVTGQETP